MTGSEYGDKNLNELEKKGQMVARAIAFATKAHEGQFRKGTKRPYIVHPLEVGEIVATLTFDEEIISAAVLHDTIEDCAGVSRELLTEEFSERVAGIVAQESEDKSKTWMERKSATIEHIRTAPKEVQMVGLADKLSNMRDIDRDSGIRRRIVEPFQNEGKRDYRLVLYWDPGCIEGVV